MNAEKSSTRSYPITPYAEQIRYAMPPLADLPAAYLALEREHGELKGVSQALRDENATLRWQLEKLRKLLFVPGKSDGVRSTEKA